MSGKRQIFALLGSSKLVAAARETNKFQGKPGTRLSLPVTYWQWESYAPPPPQKKTNFNLPDWGNQQDWKPEF
jgi:hypothetical protein